MSDIFHTLAGTAAPLAVVLLLVLAAARGVRTLGLGRRVQYVAGRHRRLALQDSVAVDRLRHLHVIRCDGRDLLLLTGGSGEVVVGWLPPPNAPTEGIP